MEVGEEQGATRLQAGVEQALLVLRVLKALDMPVQQERALGMTTIHPAPREDLHHPG